LAEYVVQLLVADLGADLVTYRAERLVITEFLGSVVLGQRPVSRFLSPDNVFQSDNLCHQGLMVLYVFPDLVNLGPNARPERFADHPQSCGARSAPLACNTGTQNPLLFAAKFSRTE